MTSQLSTSAAAFQAQIDTLQAQAAAGQLTSVTFTDATTPTITITAAQLSNDGTVLGDITGSYFIDVTGVSALNAQIPFLNPHVAAISVSDSGLSIGLELDQLESMAKAGQITSITVSDGSAIRVTPTQLTGDTDALAKIGGAVSFTVVGVTGQPNLANLSGPVSQYSFTPAADHQSLTASNGTHTYQLSDVQAVHFSDGTQLFIAQTPGDANHVTTGNVTELYSAVLAREPDVSGLTFYQNYLIANPTTPLQQFAEYFLNSTEYTSQHTYAQTTAGETQFITDSYQNLLHRTPSADEVNFYLTNVLEKPGTQMQNHAQMLVYFSASAEFLGDVQVTASNPASAQHWLVLI